MLWASACFKLDVKERRDAGLFKFIGLLDLIAAIPLVLSTNYSIGDNTLASLFAGEPSLNKNLDKFFIKPASPSLQPIRSLSQTPKRLL
jgi:hypothetical protein